MKSITTVVRLVQMLTMFTYCSSLAVPPIPLLPTSEPSPEGSCILQARDIDFKDETGHTLLIHSVQDRDIKTLQTLLQNRATPNVQDSFGWTALTYAVAGMDSSAVRILLEHKADPHFKDNKGMTILMWASLGGRIEIVQSLMDKGADVNVSTTHGATALSFAIAKGHKKVTQLLKQAGATGPQVKKAQVPKWLAPVDEIPKISNRPMPSYPGEARYHSVQGNVHLRVLFGIDGKIERMKVTRGLPYGLNEAAMQAASKLKAKPAENNGARIEYWAHVEVTFRLR